MGLFDDAVNNAMDVWFGSDYADTVTYAGTDISAIIHERGTEDNPEGLIDFIEVEVQLSDVAGIDYENDTLVIGSDTYKYPRLKSIDSYSRIIRLVKSRRARIR